MEDPYMKGNGLPAYVKLFSNGVHIEWLRCDHTDYGPAGGVGNGLKYISSRFHIMQVRACKYMGKYLLAQIFFQKGKPSMVYEIMCQ
ncbi:hypothetical protein GCM10023143_00960 [Compostibacter hankyongensis]|uniref:Uncharacterized protein n=1 Tax=Compostibacter hankyongensis TaxID=1007089 RepID=A0ABP8FC76_9BACT